MRWQFKEVHPSVKLHLGHCVDIQLFVRVDRYKKSANVCLQGEKCIDVGNQYHHYRESFLRKKSSFPSQKPTLNIQNQPCKNGMERNHKTNIKPYSIHNYYVLIFYWVSTLLGTSYINQGLLSQCSVKPKLEQHSQQHSHKQALT